MQQLPRLEDDGLVVPEVGSWAEDKYLRIKTYAQLFATSMKNRWQSRAYIDLFAGAGRARIEGSHQIIPASSMLALSIPDPFDRYIFCDKDEDKLSALRQRVERERAGLNVCFVQGDVNEKTSEILDQIPRYRPGHRVLTFCFADPYSCKNLHFATIRQLAEKYMDFLVLIPSWMDANRNLTYYERPANRTLDIFFGDPEWRTAWESSRFEKFGDFVMDYFGRQMASLGYLYSGLQDSELVRSTDKNLPLYHLALFSRHELGEKFWKQVRKYSNPQQSLFE